MVNTLYQEKSGSFQKKSAVLTIFAYLENRGSKKIGTVSLNLADLITSGKNRESLLINECADKRAKMCVSVKCNQLGDSISDNMSEGSFNSVHSVTEEFSGNILESQEISNADDEAKGKNSQSNGKKPPIFRRGSENNKISEGDKEDNFRYVEIKANNSLLEKENQRLKTEKEDIKIQFSIVSEKAKKEREMFCEHANQLDAEIDELKHQNSQLTSKLMKKSEKYGILRKNNKELLEKIEKAKENYTVAEKIRLQDELKNCKKQVFDLQKNLDEIKVKYEDLQNDFEVTENSKEQLQSLNLKYLAENSQLKLKLSEFSENFISKIPEDQSTLKKKVDSMLNSLKKELATSQTERDEAISNQTDLISEIQRLKKSFSNNEFMYKSKIKDLEFEIASKNSEIFELTERLDEEIKNSKKIERKTITEKQELDDKFNKLSKNISDLASEKALVEKNYLEHQRKFVRNRSETDTNSLEKLQKALSVYQSEIKTLKSNLLQKESENLELTEKINTFLNAEEVFENREDDHDHEDSFSNEQIGVLKKKIVAKDKENKILSEKIRVLEKEIEISEEKNSVNQKVLENQIANLKIELISLQDKYEKNVNFPKTNSEFVNNMTEESLKQELEMKKIEAKEIKNLVVKLQEENKLLEKKYMDAKVAMSNNDLQKENILIKYREAQDLMREYSTNYTMMEVEFYKINERFGQSVNLNNDLENEIQSLKSQIYELLHKKKKR